MSRAPLDKIVDRTRAAIAEGNDFDGRVTLEFGDEGAVFVDGPAKIVREGRGAADCTVRISLGDFVAIAKGEIDPAKAFLSGRLKIEGPAGAALALAQRLRDAET